MVAGGTLMGKRQTFDREDWSGLDVEILGRSSLSPNNGKTYALEGLITTPYHHSFLPYKTQSSSIKWTLLKVLR